METELDRDAIIDGLATKLATVDLTEQEAAILGIAIWPEAGEDDVEGHAMINFSSSRSIATGLQLAVASARWCRYHGFINGLCTPLCWSRRDV